MNTEPDITINGHKLAKHHAWAVRQAVLLFAAKVEHFKKIGADGPVINDCDWMLADVMKMMSTDASTIDPAG